MINNVETFHGDVVWTWDGNTRSYRCRKDENAID